MHHNKFGVVSPEVLVSSVGRLALRPIQVVHEHSTVQQACSMMSGADIGALPVVDSDGGLRGIISERDILRRLGEQGGATDTLNLKTIDLATRDVQTISTIDTIGYSLQLMALGKFRHLPVVSQQSNGVRVPVSMLSVRDIIGFMFDEFARDVEIVTHV
jgi:CBS domain-containing protein